MQAPDLDSIVRFHGGEEQWQAPKRYHQIAVLSNLTFFALLAKGINQSNHRQSQGCSGFRYGLARGRCALPVGLCGLLAWFSHLVIEEVFFRQTVLRLAETTPSALLWLYKDQFD